MSTMNRNKGFGALMVSIAALAAALIPVQVAFAQTAPELRQPVLAAAPPGSWSSQTSGTSEILWGVSCPSANVCVAVGESGTILRTVNGGATWFRQASGTTNRIESVSCPTVTTCFAVGPFPPTILITTDGGSSWSDRSTAAPSPLAAISCPNTNACAAVGIGGSTLVTHDGGGTWIAGNAGNDFLFGVSCPSEASCTAVGQNGAIFRTSDGGNTWSLQASGTDRSLFGIQCLGGTSCLTVGGNSRLGGGNIILATTDGGATWAIRRSVDVGPELVGVGCTSLSDCVAVGEAGTILGTTDGGSSWSGQDSGSTNYLQSVSCAGPSTCHVVGRQGTILVSHMVGSAEVVIPRGAPVQIAVVLPFTGFLADQGQSAWKAVQLAVEKHSRIRGFAVQLNQFNGPCGPDDGQNVLAANQVVANGQNVGVIGHFCSPHFSQALPIYEAAGLVIISGSATSPFLPSLGPDVFNDVAISDACCPYQDLFDPWYSRVSQFPSDLFWRQDVYQREFGSPPTDYADLYYDAASLLLRKIASNASLRPDGSLAIDREALARAVRTTTRFRGVTCDVTLASNGYRLNDPVSLAKCASTDGEDLSGEDLP